MWIMGHVTYSRAGLLEMISGQPNSHQQWHDLFAGGTQPQQDAEFYPPYAEVIRAYKGIHQDTLALLEKVGESGLDDTPKKVWDELKDQPDFQTNGRLFLFIAMHDMSHRGQLADVRRTLGREPFA